jgi:uncharacterized membrane protein YraQ (UPF0718 family)
METQQIVLALVTIALAGWLLLTGGVPRLEQGGRETLSLLSQIWPNFVLGILLAGLVTVAIPAELLSRHLGEDSGFRGLLIATIAGALTPGGPYFQFPLVASLYRSGVAAGPLAAYLTAWSVIPLNRTLIWEIPLLGVQFSAARLVVSATLPLLAGLAVPLVLRVLK